MKLYIIYTVDAQDNHYDFAVFSSQKQAMAAQGQRYHQWSAPTLHCRLSSVGNFIHNYEKDGELMNLLSSALIDFFRES